jgi:hypothetical protein
MNLKIKNRLKRKRIIRQVSEVQKELRTPKYRMRVVQDKRKKKEKYKNDFRYEE